MRLVKIFIDDKSPHEVEVSDKLWGSVISPQLFMELGLKLYNGVIQPLQQGMQNEIS